MRTQLRPFLMDPKADTVARIAFWGRETIVAMRMGLEDQSFYRAQIAFRYACEAGMYYRETE